jgi:hypothetical protein
MEWKDVLDMGLGAVAFVAFLKLVFSDVAELKESVRRLEEGQARANVALSRIANATEALAYREGVRLRLRKEEENG